VPAENPTRYKKHARVNRLPRGKKNRHPKALRNDAPYSIGTVGSAPEKRASLRRRESERKRVPQSSFEGEPRLQRSTNDLERGKRKRSK